MERKIGEIFEYNGEWYQCVESQDGSCKHCDMNFEGKCPIPIKECTESGRSDKSYVIFKKLEKVGEPYEYFIQGMGIIMVQEYILANANYIWEYNQDVVVMDCQNEKVAIEIKQNKEDMKEKKVKADEIIDKYYHNVITYQQFEKEIQALYADKEEIKPSLKSFSLEAAKQGKSVCTRDGRKTRILCYDFKQNEEYPILVAVENKDGKECALLYSNDGISEMYKSSNNELAMLPEKKEGWIVVRRSDIYENEERAKEALLNSHTAMMVRKITWEE